MSVRRQSYNAVGGCQSIDFDDLDLCLRLGQKYGPSRLMYEPRAVVHHFVPKERASWRYFWRRCFFVNQEKVEVFSELGGAANMGAESQFVFRSFTAQLMLDAGDLLRGRLVGLSRIGGMFIGISMAAAGNLAGRYRSRASSSSSTAVLLKLLPHRDTQPPHGSPSSLARLSASSAVTNPGCLTARP